jgi:hypothetical protein
MKQAITYNENTGVMGGAKPFDWGSISKDILNNPSATPYNFQTSQTKVLCKDGTFEYDISSSNAKYDNSKVCINNGGRAENQMSIAVKPTTDEVKQQNLLVGRNVLTTEDKFYEMLGIKPSSGGWGIQSRPLGRLLVAGVLVASYFAYKKFKK